MQARARWVLFLRIIHSAKIGVYCILYALSISANDFKIVTKKYKNGLLQSRPQFIGESYKAHCYLLYIFGFNFEHIVAKLYQPPGKIMIGGLSLVPEGSHIIWITQKFGHHRKRDICHVDQDLETKMLFDIRQIAIFVESTMPNVNYWSNTRSTNSGSIMTWVSLPCGRFWTAWP